MSSDSTESERNTETVEVPPDEEPGDEPSELSKDEAFELLNNPRRRYVLYLLDDAPEDGLEIGELASLVAAWEQDTPVADLTQQQRKRVYVSLYQTHVVRMEDLGVVEFDRDSGVVRLTERSERIRQFLPDRNEEELDTRYFLVFAAVGFAVYLAKLGGALEPVSWAAIAFLTYAGFVILTVVYYSVLRSKSRTFEDLIEGSS